MTHPTSVLPAFLVFAACATDEGGTGKEPRGAENSPAHAADDGHTARDSHSGPGHRHTGGHHRFDNAEAWAERFDDPSRDEWQKPAVVLDLLDLAPTHLLADIGAGTGYFSMKAAARVAEGKVYGVDVEPDMVRYLDERAAREGLSNVVGVLGAHDDPRLPVAVDRVLVVDTYHHISDRPAYFGALRGQLRPGAYVAIVDFRLGELPVGPPEPMKIGPDQVIEEMKAARYEVVKDERTALPYQYVLVFAPAADPS